MKTNYEVLSVAGKIHPVNQDNYFVNGWSDYINEANRKICEYESTHQIQMGTTFAGLYITPHKVISINVGDSRIYRIRDGSIRQLSKDHNEYQTMLESGIVADERRMKKQRVDCQNLIQIAERCGSRDNITAMVVCVGRKRNLFAKQRNIMKKFFNSGI